MLKWKILGAAALLLPAAFAAAATVIELGERELVARAQAIVIGEVIGASSRYRGDYIVTDFTVRLERTALKGDLAGGQIMTLTELGGEVDGLGMQVSGVPQYRIGERVAVFADARSDGSYRTLGLWQGKFRIAGAEVVGELEAQSEELGSELTGDASVMLASDGAARFPARMALEDFVRRVETLVLEQQEVRP